MNDCKCHIDAETESEKRTLRLLFVVNATMFLIEVSVGVFSQSTGLLADSLDMFADAAVYAISLYAVGRAGSTKTTAAQTSGFVQVALGFGVLFEVGRRFVVGSSPEGVLMMAMGVLALIANVFCLLLLSKHRKGEIHMRASWIFSTNDVLANLGVVTSGVLVAATASNIPDLLIGSIVSIMVTKGGFAILRETNESSHKNVPQFRP